MARFGLTLASSYTSQSVTADDEFCMNWYGETIEAQGKSQMAMYPTPGLTTFCTLVTADGLMPSIRAEISVNGRTFAVCGTNFYEVFSNGTSHLYGTLANDSLRVSMAAGATQLLIASAGQLYVFNFFTNTFTGPLAPLTGLVSQVAWIDGFFFALIANSNKVQASVVGDATTWPGLAIEQVSVFPDNLVSMSVLHRELWLHGIKASAVYYDAGLPQFPFAVNSSAGVIEMGNHAASSVVNLDNTLFWLGNDERGANIVWRANGYTPQRVSNHAVEYDLGTFATTADAVAYGYQDQGHSFYQINFPTANKTWVYDVATGLWHNRGFFKNGVFNAHRSQCHTFNFNKHLVGDTQSGNIYSMAIPSVSGSAWSNVTDFGNPIKRVRRSPHISSEQQRIFHHQLEIDMETGLGPIPPLLDGQGNPRGPILSIRWSDDGGHTWSNSHDFDCGQAGNFTTRVIARRLGMARDRVYEISGSDPVPYRLIDGYVLADEGYQYSERIPNQLRKVS